MRFVLATLLAILLLGILAPGAFADGEKVTLRSGETVAIRQVGNQTKFLLASGGTVTRTQMRQNDTAWSVSSDARTGDLHKAKQAYDLWTASQQQSVPQRNAPVWFALLLTGLGLFSLLAPHAAWYVRQGWKFRDAEPSDLALGLTRLGGGILVLIGVGLLVFG